MSAKHFGADRRDFLINAALAGAVVLCWPYRRLRRPHRINGREHYQSVLHTGQGR